MQSCRFTGFEMVTRPVRETFVFRVRGLLVMFAVWCCGSSPAWAGCGDYVIVSNPTSGVSDSGNVEPERSSRGTRVPCHGPDCRQQRPASPPTPAPLISAERSDQGVLSERTDLWLAGPAAWRAADGDALDPVRCSERVDRPPR